MARFTNKIIRDDVKEVIVNLNWQSEARGTSSDSVDIAQNLVSALDVSALSKNGNGDPCTAVSIKKGWFSTHFNSQAVGNSYSDNFWAVFLTDSLNNIILALDYGHDNVMDWTEISGLPSTKEFAKAGENPNGDLKIGCGYSLVKTGGNVRSIISQNTRLAEGSSYNITLQCTKLYV